MTTWEMVALIIGAVILAMIGQHYKEQRGAAWKKIAEKYGLDWFKPDDGYGGLSGALYDIPLRIYAEDRGGGQRQWVTTVFVATLPDDAPRSMELRAEGLGQKLVKLVGGEDIQLADPAFDAAFVVRGDEHLVRAYMEAAHRREALLMLKTRCARLWVKDRVVIAEVDKLPNADMLEQSMLIFAGLVYRHIHGASPQQGAW